MSTSEYVVYCDESRHDPCDSNRHMGIGGLWIPRSVRDELRRSLDRVARAHDLNAEIKWSKVSDRCLSGYKALIDCYATAPLVNFRVILVDHASVDLESYHDGDAELGFYKFYYQMLVKWIQPDAKYVILLDQRRNSGKGRLAKLQQVLQASVPGAEIARLEPTDSRESSLAQMADLLTGAVTAAWCGTTHGTAKAALQAHLAKVVGRTSLTSHSLSPRPSKLNVFKIQLAATGIQSDPGDPG